MQSGLQRSCALDTLSGREHHSVPQALLSAAYPARNPAGGLHQPGGDLLAGKNMKDKSLQKELRRELLSLVRLQRMAEQRRRRAFYRDNNDDWEIFYAARVELTRQVGITMERLGGLAGEW